MIGTLARKSRAALDVAIAALAVRRSRQRVAKRPIGSLVVVGRSDVVVPDTIATDGNHSRLAPDARKCADRWGAATDRALRWMPGDAACLVRAGALHELVRQRGLPRAVVRIGVRRGPDGFEAHAWVEQDGMPIAEPVALRGAFSSLDGVTLE